MIDKKTWKNIIESIVKHGDKNLSGVSWHVMKKLDDGRELCLVFGYSEGYEKDDALIQIEVPDGKIYTLCAKLAVNIDDLQCNYDMDWYEPWGEDGEVYGTDMAVIEGVDDTKWYNEQADEIAQGLNDGTLKVY